MQVSVSHTTKIVLSKLQRLDPVSIYLDNPEPGRGKITIECFGKSWSSFWPAMGGRRVEEFFVTCDDEYLAGNLSTCRSHIPVTDQDEICAWVRDGIVKRRLAGELEREDARRLWGYADSVTLTSDYCSNPDLLVAALGDDWWLCLPEKENPDYNYLVRIIQAVKDGLREYINGSSVTAA